MPYFITIFEIVNSENDSMILKEHIDYLNAHIATGQIYAKGPFMDHSGGLVIYHTATEEEARNIAENDPAIRKGTRKIQFKHWKASLPDSFID